MTINEGSLLVAKSGPLEHPICDGGWQGTFPPKSPISINCHCLYVHLEVPAGSKYEKWLSTGFALYQKL